MDCTTVDQLCLRVTSGGTPSRSNPKYWDGGTIPWMKTGEIHQGFVYFTEEKITNLGLEDSAAKIIPKNNIIVALYGDGYTAGSVAVALHKYLYPHLNTCSIFVQGFD
jgi:type I restriction enzyme, S subunit